MRTHFRTVSDPTIEWVTIHGSPAKKLPEEVKVAQAAAKQRERQPENRVEDLRAGACNDGVTDIEALLANKPQPRTRDGYELHRVGDAQSSRNIHAAILDSLRLAHVC